MGKPTDAWMPLYVADYLGDTGRLTTEQHGAYLLLIFDYWRSGPPPDDDSALAQITRLDLKGWKRHRPVIARFFHIEGGEWRHGRIEDELQNAAANAERRSDKARSAAEKRWSDSPGAKPRGTSKQSLEHAASNAASNAPGMHGALLDECPPPSPSPKEERDDAIPTNIPNPRSAPENDASTDPFDVASLAAEARRAGGVRHIDPGHIVRHVAFIREWLEAGADPPLILATIRQAVASATEPINSLAYFAAAIRQAVARRDNFDGAQPRTAGPIQRGRRPAGDDLSRVVGERLEDIGRRRRAAADGGPEAGDHGEHGGSAGLRLIASDAG